MSSCYFLLNFVWDELDELTFDEYVLLFSFEFCEKAKELEKEAEA